MKRLAAAALVFALALASPVAAQSTRWELHYSPEENLEAVDVGLIDGARETIDMAAYVLTDVAVSDALSRAAARGVAIRIFLEPAEERDTHGAVSDARDRLMAQQNVQARYNNRSAWMHLKAFCVDGRLLRFGAANFSASGEKHQDNDLAITDAADLVNRFQTHFESMWRR